MWSPSPQGSLKFNCDAAVKGDSVAVGVDCFGKRVSTSSILIAEVTKIQDAAIFFLMFGIHDVLIEIDNCDVINFCSKSNHPP